MNMKRNYLILALAAVLSLFASCGKEADPFDDTRIWDAIEQLKNRVTALETAVAENVSAIQSMVSLGSISSWEFDAETGKAVITLLDGKKITISQNMKGYSLISVLKDDDGVYYWAICKDGVSEPLLIDGKKVPVTVTPALKISEDKMWMISVDGGKTWVNTGIEYQEAVAGPQPPVEDETGLVFFQDVKQEGGYLILTLADGTAVKVAIVGEASFTASSDTLWFSRTGMEKSVAVEMVNVKAYTITEKPEGWKARMDGEYLYVSSPESFIGSPRQGTVKVLAVFEAVQTPAILSLEVVHDPMFTLSYVNGKASVALSSHTGEDFNGYVLAGWKKDEFSVEKAVAWLNAEAGNLVPFTGSADYAPSDIISDYSETESYVIVAVPYLPAMQVAQGNLEYTSEDIQHVSVKSVGKAWTFSEVRFDSADFRAEMSEPFFGGFFKLEDWNNYGRDNFLETLEMNGAEPCTIKEYSGPANGFPYGDISIDIEPATEYVVWYVAEKTSGAYVAEDFITYTFTTPDVTADPSVAAPAFVTRDITTSGFTADVTPASGAYKTYAAITKSAAIPETEAELVRYLIHVNKFSKGTSVNTVSSSSFNSEDEVYLTAVSLTEDGRYGKVVKEKVELKTLTFTDAIGVEVTGIEYGLGDVTLSLNFKGNPEYITYLAATYTFYDDETLQKLMALGQMGDASRKKVSSLNGEIYLDGLTLGAEHTFYAVVTDAEGNASYLYKYEFTPVNNIDYIQSGDADYEYGMPKLTGTCKGTNSSYTLTLDVEMPSTCRKYWLFKGNYEYFTGDPWTDSDKLVTEQFMEVTVHTESETGLTYTYMNPTSRIYMVWQDDKDGFHAIYEFNPKKQ